jgi:hypothetical protein
MEGKLGLEHKGHEETQMKRIEIPQSLIPAIIGNVGLPLWFFVFFVVICFSFLWKRTLPAERR